MNSKIVQLLLVMTIIVLDHIAPVVSAVGPSQYSVRVLDLNDTGGRRAMVVMDDKPYVFQYGNRSYGTTEFCLLGQKPDTPKTCFRTADKFDAGTNEVQRLHFTAAWN